MGSCVSVEDPAQFSSKARSDEIDRQIEQDAIRAKREYKILLLGTMESGKSALVKQMKIAHSGGFSEEERIEYRPVVYQNLLDAARRLLRYMQKTGIQCAFDSNGILVQKIQDYEPDEDHDSLNFSPEIAEAIGQLLKDPIVSTVMDEHSKNLDLMESGEYFLRQAFRIASPHYLPNDTDVLKAQESHEHARLVETRFATPSLTICILDVGGQRSERKKWIHHFESVVSIMFVVGLDEYDQGVLEDEIVVQNRLVESIVLFESVINSRWLREASVILMLNKIDLFKRKILKVPLINHFPEYTGGDDINKAAKFILWKFMQTNRAHKSVYPHLTQSTDTTNFRLVFAAVKETILQNALRNVRNWTGSPIL